MGSEKFKECMTSCCLVPQRFVIIFMCFLVNVSVFALRQSLSIILADIKKNNGESYNSSDKQIINAAYYVGYIIAHLPAGIVSDKYGGRCPIGIGVVVGSIVTILMPVCMEKGGVPATIILRVICGLSAGILFPAISSILSRWAPPTERSTMMTFVSSGAHVGSIAAAIIAGGMGSFGFTGGELVNIFYYVGFPVLFFCVFWFALVYDDPDTHPFIKDGESEMLKNVIKAKPKIRKVPWLKIISSGPVWAIVSGQVAHAWCFFLIATNFSTYLKDVLDYDIKKNGFLSAVPWFVLLTCTIIVGPICDRQIKRGTMSMTTARKVYTVLGNVPSAIFLLCASYAGQKEVLVQILFNLAMAFKCGIYTGLRTNILDLAPNFSGFIMAFVNMMGAVAAVIIPFIVAGVVKDDPLHEWRIVIWVVFIVMCVLTAVYCIFASGETQSWNEIQETPPVVQFTN